MTMHSTGIPESPTLVFALVGLTLLPPVIALNLDPRLNARLEVGPLGDDSAGLRMQVSEWVENGVYEEWRLDGMASDGGCERHTARNVMPKCQTQCTYMSIAYIHACWCFLYSLGALEALSVVRPKRRIQRQQYTTHRWR